jgi:hypothetical protein
MAENKEKVEETIKEEPKVDNEVGKLRMKKRKYANNPDSVTKVNLNNPPKKDEKVEEKPVEEKEVVVVNKEPEVTEEVKEEVKEEAPIIQEVTKEEIAQAEEEVIEAVEEAIETGKALPENIQKLVDFMDETGGDIKDYVELNRDISKMDDSEVLDEYYRKTKSHLSPEERNFILEEKFSYDEETEDPKDIKRKKIALKEQVAEAKAHLDRQKSKYYEEIKAGSRLTPEAKKAMDFFNRYNKDQAKQKKITDASKRSFKQKTDSIFNKNFKGFDYSIGDKTFRFNVKDADKVKETQSDLNNFINKFADKNSSQIDDVAGYHKSLFTAMNADSIAQHFYEQGKADAIKGQIASDKNINTDARQTHGETNVGGVKYRVLGDSSNDLRLRIKNRRK